MKRAILFLVMFFSGLALYGQYQAVVSYTTRDGLLSSELLTVFVDSQGFVWTGSTSGVSRFDGKSFRNITIEQGLAENGTQKILEDEEGRIWFIHSGYSDKLKASIWTEEKVEVLDIAALTRKSTFNMFWNKHAGEIQFFAEGEIWAFDPDVNTFSLKAALAEPLKSRVGFIGLDPFQERFLLLYEEEKPQYRLHTFTWKDGKATELPTLTLGGRPSKTEILGMPGGEILIQVPGQSLILDASGDWKPFSIRRRLSDGHSAYLHKDHSAWSWNEGGEVAIYEVNPLAPRGISLKIRTPNPVGQVARSPDGTYWLATRGGLLHVFPAFLDFTVENCRNQALSDIHAICEDNKGNMWFGSYTFGFSYFDGEEVKAAPGFMDTYYGVLPGSMRDEEGRMWFWVEQRGNIAFDRGLIAFDGTTPPSIILQDTLGYYFHQAYDGETGLGLNEYGLGIIDPQKACSECVEVIGEGQGFELLNVITTVKDRYGRWWMGRPSAGFCYYDPAQDTIYSWLRENPREQLGIMSSLMDARGNLWFGTTHGLRFFRNREKIDPVTFDPRKEFREVGLKEMGESQVNAMILYDENTLIAGNQEGITLIDLRSFYEEGPTRIYFMSQADGYLGDGTEQNCIWMDANRQVWIGSNSGVHRFDPSFFLRNTEPPGFSIDSLVYGGVSYPVRGQEKMIRLPRATALSPKLSVFLGPDRNPIRARHLRFSYKLSTDSTFSSVSDKPALEFLRLGPGRYTLKIKALKDGLESEVQTVRFHIPKHLLATPWPYLGVLLAAGFGFWAYQYRRNRILLERNKLQVQAIVNQLNPHFINNALQWVQIRVYKDVETVSVISKLGENIRLVFKNSRNRKAFHSLKEEMQLVQNYLHIQKKRFGDHLEYQLPPTAALEAFGEIELPLMQVQIHCENAVEHGVRNKEEPGRLVVRLIDKEPFLHIIVEDNGVGRRRAAELGSKGTQQGTKMLDSLMEIFNKHNALKLRSYYEDDIFSDELGRGYGTRVHIWIPKKYHYEFD